MATKYPDCKDPDSFQSGLEFQDFVCTELAKHGIILQNLASKKAQFEIGENLQGFEIKLDRRCTETHRLSIEIAEKTRADRTDWTPSGIYRSDNTWLYIQGNYEALFIFSLKVLRQLHATGRFPASEYPVGHPTIRRFFLPFDIAERNCCKVIYCRQ
jgi:hypothetical protein